jgi:hypothetical protein
VPELIRWLRHDEPYVLFIAAYSLKRITGEDPTFYYFGTPGEPFNGEDKWFERCVETWRKWHEDRVHGKDQGN